MGFKSVMAKGLIAKAGVWLLLDSASAAIGSFIFFIATARMLGVAQFGVSVLTLSVVGMLGPVVECMFHDALIQREVLEREHIRTASTVALATGAALTAALCLGAPLISNLLRTPEMTPYLRVISIALVFTGLGAAPTALARRSLQFRTLTIRTAAARLLGLVVGFTALFMGRGIWSVVAQFVTTTAAAAIFLIASVRPEMTFKVSRRHLSELLGFAAPSLGTQLLVIASGRVSAFIIGSLMGAISAGVWQVGYRFIEAAYLFIGGLVNHLALTVLSRQRPQGDDLLATFREGSARAALIIAPAFTGLAVCAPQLIRVIVGAQWMAAAPLMAIVSLASMVMLLRMVCESMLATMGEPKLNFFVYLQATGLSVLGIVIGARFGLEFATLGWALRVIPFVITFAIFARRALGASFRQQLEPILTPLAACAVMAACVYTVEALLPHLPPQLLLAAMIATGVASYGAAAALISRTFREEVVEAAAFARRLAGAA